jgi:hypothetical protein
MAALPQELSPRQPLPAAEETGSRLGCAAWVALLVLVCAAGCESTGTFICTGEQPPTGPAFQVVAWWNNQVLTAPDPVHGGAATPGLAGRVYLFGPQLDFPIEGDGTIVVDLYDPSAPTTAPGGTAVPLEEWRFDKDTLKRLQRKDVIGWGYTVFLPWGSYRPEIKQVRLQVRYEPPKGSPLYAESSPLALIPGEDIQVTSKSVPLGTPPGTAPAAAVPSKDSGVRPASAGPADAGRVVPAVAPGVAK